MGVIFRYQKPMTGDLVSSTVSWIYFAVIRSLKEVIGIDAMDSLF